jgi:hypothetical protein
LSVSLRAWPLLLLLLLLGSLNWNKRSRGASMEVRKSQGKDRAENAAEIAIKIARKGGSRKNALRPATGLDCNRDGRD